jgi:hypothetical protein
MKCHVLRPALLVAALTLTACSGPETTTASSNKEPAKTESAAPPAPVTAKTAFWEMYKSAHAWAPDMLSLTLEAKTISGIKNEDGKAAMWEAHFGSLSKKQYAKFSYSITAQPPDIRKGVSVEGAVPWAGPTHDALAFQSSEFAIDSDEAYKTALEKAGSWIKQHPDIPLTTMSLGAASRFPGPVWYFLWGDKKLGFFQLVSATTGKALR